MSLKRVSKETLLGDIQYRGAISDFTVVRKQISEADYEDLLMRYNEDDVYGDGNNFEIAVTKSAAEGFEKQEAERAFAKAEAETERAEASRPVRREKTKPESKLWVSLGSEAEIEAESVVENRTPKMEVQVCRERSSFGKPCRHLVDVDAITLWNSASMECRPFKEKNPSARFAEADVAVQAVPSTTTRATQATPLAPKPMSTQYEPRRFSGLETAGTSASLELSGLSGTSLRAFLEKVDPLVRLALQQNECYDIFTDDFASLADDDAAQSTAAHMVESYSFTSLKHNKGKTVSCIDWMPGALGVVAVSCVDASSFETSVNTGGTAKPGAVLIWDFEDPIHPKYVLQAPSDVHCFQFNETKPALVAGGLANGRACFWDMSETLRDERDFSAAAGGERTTPVCHPKFVSEAPYSHACPVTDVRWLGADVAVTKPRGELARLNPLTGECTFFATTAGDGKVLFWDVDIKKDAKRRDFFLRPSHKITLGRGEQSGTFQTVKFDFSPSLRPPGRDGSLPENATRFFASSADGEIAQCDFVIPADEEGCAEHTKLCCAAHYRAVGSISRSPFFPDLVMSCGATSFKLWREGNKTPVFSSPRLSTRFVSCSFSPTRPSVVYVAKEDGVVDAWDLLERSHEPSISTRVNSAAVGPIKFRTPTKAEGEKPREQLLAVGDAGGVLHVVRAPRALRKPKLRELERTEAFLHREMARAVDAAERAATREAATARRERAAAAAGGGAEEKPARVGTRGECEMTEDERREAEYLALEEAFMIEMGLRDAPVKEE